MVDRLFLFDIDGTLLHPGGVGRAATHAAMLEIFGIVDGLDSHHFSGKTDWHTLTELLGKHGYTADDIAQHRVRVAVRFDVNAFPEIAADQVARTGLRAADHVV